MIERDEYLKRFKDKHLIKVIISMRRVKKPMLLELFKGYLKEKRCRGKINYNHKL